MKKTIIGRSFILISIAICFCFPEVGATQIFQAPGKVGLQASQTEGKVYTVAKKKRRKRRKRRRKKRDSSRIERGYVATSGLKVGLGLALAEETTYLLSGDFEYPFHKLVKSTPKGLMLVTGIHYFGYSVGAGSVSLIGLETGVDYHYGLTNELHIFGGARVTMGRASVEVETNVGNIDATETNYYLTPVIGIAYDLKGVTLGGEIRLPFEEDLDVTYILFTGKFSLN